LSRSFPKSASLKTVREEATGRGYSNTLCCLQWNLDFAFARAAFRLVVEARLRAANLQLESDCTRQPG
jgi:hypothetical protein